MNQTCSEDSGQVPNPWGRRWKPSRVRGHAEERPPLRGRGDVGAAVLPRICLAAHEQSSAVPRLCSIAQPVGTPGGLAWAPMMTGREQQHQGPDEAN